MDINKNEIKLKINNKTYSIPINNFYYSDGIYNVIKAIKAGWEYKDNYWEKDGIKLKHLYGIILQIFEEKDHKFLNVKDKSVLDIVHL